MKIEGKIVERPQHMWMRVSLAIHGDNLEKAFETYDLLSDKYFTHATPTLFNAGTPRPQMSSCYLIACGDSIDDNSGNVIINSGKSVDFNSGSIVISSSDNNSGTFSSSAKYVIVIAIGLSQQPLLA